MRHLHHAVRFFIVLPCLLPSVTPAWGAPKVEEKTLVTMGEGVKLTLGPKNHVAAIIPKGSKMAAVTDGVEGPKVDELFKPDGDKYFKDNPGSPFVFDDDGNHCAYLARQGTELLVVLDGKEHARFKDVESKLTYPLSLSPTGGKVYFAVNFKNLQRINYFDGRKFFYDGKELPRPDGAVKFNADASKYVYRVARPGKGGGLDYSLIVNGEEKKIRAVQFDMTTDGKVIAFDEVIDPAKGRASYRVLQDDKVVAESLPIQPYTLKLGPHGSWAFIASPAGDNIVAYLNGQKAAELPKGADLQVPQSALKGANVDPVIFSPDGKRIAIVVKSENGDHSVLVDGKSAGEYASIYNVAFTGDSAKIGYFARARNGGNFVVINDEESDPQKDMQPDSLSVSPTSDIVCYHAKTGAGESTLFANHKKIGTVKPIGGWGPVQFTANGKNLFFHLPQEFVWLNGTTIPVGHLSQFAVNADATKWAACSINQEGTGLDLITGGGGKSQRLKGRLVEMTYTPDGNHLVTAFETGQNKSELGIDGATVKTVNRLGVAPISNNDIRNTFASHPDGSLTVLAFEGDELKRLTIKP